MIIAAIDRARWRQALFGGVIAFATVVVFAALAGIDVGLAFWPALGAFCFGVGMHYWLADVFMPMRHDRKDTHPHA